MATPQLRALNESGFLIGEDHPRAVLSDREVELMRQLHEEGELGLTALARKFEVSKRTVWRIVTYRLRNQTAARWIGEKAPRTPAR